MIDHFYIPATSSSIVLYSESNYKIQKEAPLFSYCTKQVQSVENLVTFRFECLTTTHFSLHRSLFFLFFVSDLQSESESADIATIRNWNWHWNFWLKVVAPSGFNRKKWLSHWERKWGKMWQNYFLCQHSFTSQHLDATFFQLLPSSIRYQDSQKSSPGPFVFLPTVE